MFNLNPLDNPNAWWQLSIIFIVACAIGYILGNFSGKDTIHKLQLKLRKLEADLRMYELKKININQRSQYESQKAPIENKNQIDDLKRISGIGVQVENFLHRHAIYRYNQLATLENEYLVKIFKEAGDTFKEIDTSTWSKQAILACEGKWYELKKWQEELDKTQI